MVFLLVVCCCLWAGFGLLAFVRARRSTLLWCRAFGRLLRRVHEQVTIILPLHHHKYQRFPCTSTSVELANVAWVCRIMLFFNTGHGGVGPGDDFVGIFAEPDGLRALEAGTEPVAEELAVNRFAWALYLHADVVATAVAYVGA